MSAFSDSTTLSDSGSVDLSDSTGPTTPERSPVFRASSQPKFPATSLASILGNLAIAADEVVNDGFVKKHESLETTALGELGEQRCNSRTNPLHIRDICVIGAGYVGKLAAYGGWFHDLLFISHFLSFSALYIEVFTVTYDTLLFVCHSILNACG